MVLDTTNAQGATTGERFNVLSPNSPLPEGDGQVAISARGVKKNAPQADRCPIGLRDENRIIGSAPSPEPALTVAPWSDDYFLRVYVISITL